MFVALSRQSSKANYDTHTHTHTRTYVMSSTCIHLVGARAGTDWCSGEWKTKCPCSNAVTCRLAAS